MCFAGGMVLASGCVLAGDLQPVALGQQGRLARHHQFRLAVQPHDVVGILKYTLFVTVSTIHKLVGEIFRASICLVAVERYRLLPA